MRPVLPALAATALVFAAGCNIVFGLDEVSQKAPAGSGGAGGSGGSGGGGGPAGGAGGGPAGGSGGAAGGACQDLSIPGNLLGNSSFEEDGVWQTMSGDTTIDYVADSECGFTCGARFGRISRQGETGVSNSLTIAQGITQKIELGGELRFRARYRHTTGSAYFTLIGNGYDFGGLLKGNIEGDHLAISEQLVIVDDPRRAAGQFSLFWTQNFDTEVGTSDLDCLAITYTPPPGDELLPNGWFENGATGWQAALGASLDAVNFNGLCGPFGGVLTVPASTNGDVLSTTVPGSWPAGTVFKLGGAAGPVSGEDTIPVPTVTLHLDYADDGQGPPSEEVQVTGTLPGHLTWYKATAMFTTTREVVSATVRLGVDTTSLDPPGAASVVADCFSLRAVTP